MFKKPITRTKCKYYLIECICGVVAFLALSISAYNKEILFLETRLDKNQCTFLYVAGFLIMIWGILLGRWGYKCLQYMDLHGVDSMYASDLKKNRPGSNTHNTYHNTYNSSGHASSTRQNTQKIVAVCPRCKGKCSVPQGRGHIKVTCPRCKQVFDMNT